MPFVEIGSGSESQSGDDVIDEATRLLLSGQREQMNKLAVNADTDATTLTMKYELQGIAANAIVCIDTEAYRVWEVQTESRTATVEPGMNGSRSTTHTAGSLVYVNPRFPRYAAFKALNDELRSLSAPALGLFAVESYEFAYNAAQTDYDLVGSTNVIRVLDVKCSQPGPTKHWFRVDAWLHDRNADLTTFPSGNSVFIPSAIPGQTIRVLYAVPYLPLARTTDDLVTAAGIAVEAQDILAMGVLLRLGGVREIKRSFTEAQGDARRATEVPPNAVQNSFTGVRQLREQRIQQEANRLATLYPQRRR